jgi:hypothetical protein
VESKVEEQRVAVEVIATLVHLKNATADLILKPAGVPSDIYLKYLYGKNENTGRQLTKRQAAPLIIEAIRKRRNCEGVIRRILEIAANWSSFHLADDEYIARATVQKARELLGTIESQEAEEAQRRERTRQEEIARMERERADVFKKQLELLRMMFDDLYQGDDPHKRGYLLQDLLNRLFDLNDIPVFKSFTRNEGAEQIDGAFKLEGWHYLVECRWRERLADIRQLDGLKGQIDRSGKQTMGLFLSINGWSEHVVPLLKQNPGKSIILMEGYDLRTVLCGQVDLRDFLLTKIAKFNLDSEPYFSVTQYINEQQKG